MNRKPRKFTEVVLGRPIETARAMHEAIGKVPALAVFASDALSSVAYASEEILVVLSLAGLAAFRNAIPIALAICGLLILIAASYRQTILAYPDGGGAYSVARENLGMGAARIASAALMTDYVLTVAVSMSSGVAQLVSAFPALAAYRVYLVLGLVWIVAVINLRGTRESSAILSVPTYFFLAMMALTLGVGFFRWATGSLAALPVSEPLTVLQPVTVFLILRAFSSGSTALTGVEAIANGVTAFKEPRSKNAATTLVVMAGILITMFLGTTLLAHQIGAIPNETETVISQVARAVHGSSAFYLLALAGTTAILFMAANTSFADFPRLGALQARDGLLPRQLTVRGSRLVFSWGITVLALLASVLVVIFQASVTALIPLYAVGVFLSFTLSQSGMVVHWFRLRPAQTEEGELVAAQDPRWLAKMLINAAGALVTGVVTIIFVVTKFTHGAWVIVVVIPLMLWFYARVNRHYRGMAQVLSLNGVQRTAKARPMHTLVLVDRLHAMAMRTIDFVTTLGMPWEAVHVSIDPQRTEELKRRWAERMGDKPLVVLESPYRSLSQPLLDYVHRIRRKRPGAFIHIVLGGLIHDTYWEQALHENSDLVVGLSLRQIDGIVITTVPFHPHYR